MKHLIMVIHQKPKGPTPPVCKTELPVDRTFFPRQVDCPMCIDWMAVHSALVIEQVEKLARPNRCEHVDR
jgi:hypothetical protein